MKKNIIFFCLFFLLCGCSKIDDDELIKDLNKKITKSKNYELTATLQIFRNEEKFTYDVVSTYQKEDNFKVKLINKTNNHEQIILKHDNTVYVLTPSLNKSFKFQSDWPYNNSQTYILQTIVADIENDSEKDIIKTDSGYTITTSVNYSNKKDLVKQNIYLDKDGNLYKVEVINSENQPKIVMNFSKIDYNVNINDDSFNIDKNVVNNTETDIPVSNIDGIVFPMYVPADTYLTSQDIITVEGGERAILTFNGEKPFTIIQETVSSQNSLNTSVDGEPYIIMDTIGVLSDSYVSWISNGIEYYVISEELTQEELITVANSISVMPVSK